MDILNQDKLKELMSKRNNPSVSIYIPTHRKGAEVEQDHIRFKNQLREIEKKLLTNNFKQQQVDELLNPAKQLIDNIDFWNHQSDGLAVFISPKEFLYYRIPEYFEEQNSIADRYHTRPLIKMMNGNIRFLLLTLNQKNIRLFESTRFTINEIELKDVPVSIEEFFASEEEDGSLRQSAVTMSVSAAGGRNPVGAAYHGQAGFDAATHKEKIQQFFHLVDTSLQKYLNAEKAPLLIAGVEYLIPLYKEANTYPYILEKSLQINTQDLSEQELRDAAWDIIKSKTEENIQNALNQYGNYAGTQRASDKVDEIIKNSFSNRILYLFINPDEKVWGKFEPN